MAEHCAYRDPSTGRQCGAYRAQGTLYCEGHRRMFSRLAEADAADTDDSPVEPPAPAREALPEIRLESAHDALAAFALILGELRRGEIDTRKANCMSYLLTAFVRGTETAGLEAAVRDLAAEVERLKGRGT